MKVSTSETSASVARSWAGPIVAVAPSARERPVLNANWGGLLAGGAGGSTASVTNVAL